MFEEIDLCIPYIPFLSKIECKEKKYEHFSNEDYEALQSTLQSLRAKQNELNQKIEEQRNKVSNMSDKREKYNTFHHLFENTEERNESYYKMILFMVTLIIILILCIVSYFIYRK